LDDEADAFGQIFQLGLLAAHLEDVVVVQIGWLQETSHHA
jgi:hypothetical protein